MVPPITTGFSPETSFSYWYQFAWLVPFTIWVTRGFTVRGAAGAAPETSSLSDGMGLEGGSGVRGTARNAANGLTGGSSTSAPLAKR